MATASDLHLLTVVLTIIFIISNPSQAICVPRDSPNPSNPTSSVPSFPPSPSPLFPPSQTTAPQTPYHIQTSNPPSPAPDSSTTSTNGGGFIDNHVIDSICNATDHPSLCVSSIMPFLGSGKIDVQSVLEMAIKACLQHSKIAINASAKFTPAMGTASSSSSATEVCKESYSDALDNFENALDALDSNDIGTVTSMLSAAIADYSACEDAFMGSISPWIAFAGALINLTSNCLAIAALL